VVRDDRPRGRELCEGGLDRRAEPRSHSGGGAAAPGRSPREDAQDLLRDADCDAAAHVPPVRERPGRASRLLRALPGERAPRAVRLRRLCGAVEAPPASPVAHPSRDVTRSAALALGLILAGCAAGRPARDPLTADQHNDLGVAYFEQGEPQRAATEFDRALALRPDWARALVNLGDARLAL